jgi:hypothetical protein
MNTMSMTTIRRLAGIAAALLLSPVLAANPVAPGSAEARYQQERATCLSGASQQDRSTCLREAGAALAEARRARLDNGEDARALRANALQRCKAQPPQDRDACERLARGEGSVSGSVDGGGVVKEVVTPVIEPAAAPSTLEPAPAR